MVIQSTFMFGKLCEMKKRGHLFRIQYRRGSQTVAIQGLADSFQVFAAGGLNWSVLPLAAV